MQDHVNEFLQEARIPFVHNHSGNNLKKNNISLYLYLLRNQMMSAQKKDLLCSPLWAAKNSCLCICCEIIIPITISAASVSAMKCRINSKMHFSLSVVPFWVNGILQENMSWLQCFSATDCGFQTLTLQVSRHKQYHARSIARERKNQPKALSWTSARDVHVTIEGSKGWLIKECLNSTKTPRVGIPKARRRDFRKQGSDGRDSEDRENPHWDSPCYRDSKAREGIPKSGIPKPGIPEAGLLKLGIPKTGTFRGPLNSDTP